MVAEAPGGGDDGDIINRTRQNRNEQGCTQFETTLPSGRTVTSEWLNPDQLKKALLPWIESIKGQLAADREEYEASRRRAAMAKKAALPPAIVDAAGAPIAAVIAEIAPVPAIASSDPVEHAKNMLVATNTQLQQWTDKEAEAGSMVAKLSKQASRWEQVLNILRKD